MGEPLLRRVGEPLVHQQKESVGAERSCRQEQAPPMGTEGLLDLEAPSLQEEPVDSGSVERT